MNLGTSDTERELEILNVLNCYAWSYDSDDMDQMAAIFAEDGTTVGTVAGLGVSWGPWTGGREIANKLGAIRKSQADRRRHQITTPVFLRLTDQEALVKAYLSLFSTPTGAKPCLATTGQYVAALSRSSGRWKITRLECELDGPF